MEQDRDTYKALIDSTINTNSTKAITGALANTAHKNLADSVVFKNENRGKANVRFATTGAVTLATGFEDGDTVDGVVLATGDRFLNKDASDATENGLYTVNASGAPTRATDFDSSSDITTGQQVYVEEGTVNGGKYYYLSAPTGTITLGVSSLVFSPSASTVVDINGASLFSGTIDTTNDKALIYDASAAANLGIPLGRLVPLYGTFTPAIAFGGGTTGITYGTRFGQFSETTQNDGKIRVDFDGNINWTDKGSSTGEWTITGLPRVSSANVLCLIAWTESGSGGVIDLTSHKGRINTGATTITVLGYNATAGSYDLMTSSNVFESSGSLNLTVYFSGSYIYAP